MPGACVAHKDLFDFHVVATIRRTRINRMTVVNTAADRVTLNHLDAHVDSGDNTCCRLDQITRMLSKLFF